MKSFTLNNGLRIHLYQKGNTETAVINLTIHAGLRYEDKSNRGISHVLEHMFFEGTKKYPSRKLFDEYVKNIGFEFNANTYHENILMYAYFPYVEIEPMLEILSEMVFSPALSEDAFEPERQIILNEIMEDNYSQEKKYQNLFYGKVYKNSFIKYNNLGTRKNVKNFTIEDIRKWHKKCCYPANMTLCITADFKKLPQIQLQIEKIFTKMESRKKLPFSSFKIASKPLQSQYRVFFAPNTDSKEKNIDFQFNTQSYFKKQKEILMLDFIEKIADDYIYEMLRKELNLVYECNFDTATFSDIQTWHSTFVGSYTKIIKILKRLFFVIDDLINTRFSDALFYKAKRQELFDFDSLNDDPRNLCGFIAEKTLFFNDFISIQKAKSLISKMDKKEVQKFLTKIFDPANFNFIFYGNLTSSQKEKLKKLIHKQLG